MPNSQNRSKDQSNIVKPKRKATKASATNQEPVGKKEGGSQVRHASSGTSSGEGGNSEAGGKSNT
jgi:hypothetical protein